MCSRGANVGRAAWEAMENLGSEIETISSAEQKALSYFNRNVKDIPELEDTTAEAIEVLIDWSENGNCGHIETLAQMLSGLDGETDDEQVKGLYGWLRKCIASCRTAMDSIVESNVLGYIDFTTSFLSGEHTLLHSNGKPGGCRNFCPVDPCPRGARHHLGAARRRLDVKRSKSCNAL